jgi:DNA-binding winged helix-turn-helix (wHTH) protein
MQKEDWRQPNDRTVGWSQRTHSIEAAWPGLAIEDSNLTVQIAALRRALGEEPGGEASAGVGTQT